MDIRKYIGCKYKSHGRTIEDGLDCYGLAILMYRDMGIELPDPFYPDTKKETNEQTMIDLEKAIPNMKIDRQEEGAIVELNVFGEPSHIGICLGNGDFIHATSKYGTIIDKLYRWEKRIKGYYRVLL